MEKFKLDDEIAGICMQAYYGGRAEIRIRHTLVPVIYTDFTSQYPTVNTLLGLWRMLTAEKLHVRDTTQEIREFLESLTPDQLLNPATWSRLTFFGLVLPDADIFPVRTVYGDENTNDQTNIGLNPLTSNKPLWFAGPDIIGSFLLTGKVPRILRAIRFEPEGVQQGMKSVQLGNGSIDPYADDFFRKVIEERKSKDKSDPLYYFLKILANAGCYGIYAEVNRVQSGKNDRKKIGIFSGDERRTESSCTVEAPGPWYFPPVAALITAGGRLLLAILERMVADAGGTYLMCDTDSMAIVASEEETLVPCKGGPYRTSDGTEAIKALSRKKVQQMVDSLTPLNPYRNVDGSILNVVEELNLDSDKNPRQLWGWGNSAKRYILGEFVEKQLKLIKVSEHGLGLYYRPKEGRDPECEVALWVKEGWQWILNGALGLSDEKPDWFSLPVMRRIAITTPNVMKTLRTLSRDRARPYNFALSPVLVNLTNTPIILLGPFEKDSSKWSSMRYVDVHTGTVHKLNPPTLFALPQTFEMKFGQYCKHPEHKSLAPDGSPCSSETAGLLKRYPVIATEFGLMGKETERGWEHSEDVSTLMPRLKHYGENHNSADVRLQTHLRQIPLAILQDHTGLSRHTIVRARRGKRVHQATLRFLSKAVAAHTFQQRT